MLKSDDSAKKFSLACFAPFLTSLVLACFVTAAAYQLFFLCAPFVWSCNVTFPLFEYLPDVRHFVQGPRNGIQVYVLHVLVCLIVGGTFLLYYFFEKIPLSFLRRGLLLLFALPCALFLLGVGFMPPMAKCAQALGRDVPAMIFILSVLGITLILSLLINRPRTLAITLAILLFPACMIASGAYSIENYDYILFPAMRIFHGFPFNQTSFQYDHFLSLLVALWVKLDLSFYSFSLLGQISIFAFFMAVYLWGNRFFTHKCYALYWIICAVLVRMYGNLGDITREFQVTPLRLDWWFVVLAVFFYKGGSHWLMGAVLSFLLVFHHAFGAIYTLTYVLFVLSLCAGDIISKKNFPVGILRSYGALYAKNTFLIGFSFLIYRLFFAFGQSTTSVYQQHGIGFLPISGQSFYWYVPLVLSLALIFNWRNKRFLPERDYRTGLFLILLAIGNSLYFFGRSHENNIINISSALLLCLFMLFDLVHSEWDRIFASGCSKWVFPALAVCFIGGVSWVYSGRAPERILQQAESLWTHRADGRDRGMEQGLREHTEIIKRLTKFNPKVIFVSKIAGYYYCESGYVPQSPYAINGWLTMKKLVDFLNAQLLKDII